VANRRKDKWGGSIENRVRIVSEIVDGIKRAVPERFSISIKLNSDDHVPGGVTVLDASCHIRILKSKLDFFEISNGVNRGKFWSIRYNLDRRWLKELFPDPEQREAMFKKGKELEAPFTNQYNIPDIIELRRAHPDVKLAAVGGLRNFEEMEKLVKGGIADLVSMSRPFIRNPNIVKHFRTRRLSESDCGSCGACLLRILDGRSLQCDRWAED
jgi:2,4-dienoyl-CoA reductase-like NADH-dependent reductase (Old Yellow Enzyme family)